MLESDELEPVYAKVCWRRELDYGLVFEETLSYMRLAKIVAGSRQFEPPAPPEERAPTSKESPKEAPAKPVAGEAAKD